MTAVRVTALPLELHVAIERVELNNVVVDGSTESRDAKQEDIRRESGGHSIQRDYARGWNRWVVDVPLPLSLLGQRGLKSETFRRYITVAPQAGSVWSDYANAAKCLYDVA
jgi:hypothetical protein